MGNAKSAYGTDESLYVGFEPDVEVKDHRAVVSAYKSYGSAARCWLSVRRIDAGVVLAQGYGSGMDLGLV